MLRVQRCVPEIFNPSKLHKSCIIYRQENRKMKGIQEKEQDIRNKELNQKALMPNKRNW